MVPASDYAKAVYALQHPSLPAYVSYVSSASAHGIAGDSDGPHTVYVRTKDGAVVSGTVSNVFNAHYQNGNGDTNPISRRIFAPACYAAQSEERVRWQGVDALRITLQPLCGDSEEARDRNPFSDLYVDPVTLAPIGTTGSIGSEGVTVDFEQHFARFGSYTMPSELSVHVHGRGLLFWMRERADVRYSSYQFYTNLPKGVVRRQASAGEDRP